MGSASRVSEALYSVEGELLCGGFGGRCAYWSFEVDADVRIACATTTATQSSPESSPESVSSCCLDGGET